MYAIITAAGEIMVIFVDEQDRDEALLSGEYPEDAEPAYVQDTTVLY